MEKDFEELLDNYADLVLKVGLNLQQGQRLKIGSVSEIYRVPFEAAPLVRKIALKAYQMGASLVEVFWGDEQLNLIRCMHAMTETLDEYPSWIAGEIESSASRGGASIGIWGEDPYLLSDVDPDRIAIMQKARARALEQSINFAAQNPSNWCGVNYPTSDWATAVFPDLQSADAIATLWDYIIQFCRLDTPDPIGYWHGHNDDLESRAQWLTDAQYKSLNIKSPDTDLSMDLPRGHIWFGGRVTLPNGVEYSPNIPTEEVCTLPDRKSVSGYLHTTKPFSYRGINIEGMRLEFENGKVVKATAKEGEEMLNKILETDDGASRLGEVALVPNSSPISQSQILFHNLLIDENASVHLALGDAPRFFLTNGDEMDKEEFMASGGNSSTIHIDFMIGSSEMDIDGIKKDGTYLPLMRAGEWAITL
jgi:aminopeptidase